VLLEDKDCVKVERSELLESGGNSERAGGNSVSESGRDNNTVLVNKFENRVLRNTIDSLGHVNQVRDDGSGYEVAAAVLSPEAGANLALLARAVADSGTILVSGSSARNVSRSNVSSIAVLDVLPALNEAVAVALLPRRENDDGSSISVSLVGNASNSLV